MPKVFDFSHHAPKEKASDFEVGMEVLYVPNHAHGNIEHEHVEKGIISTIKPGVEDRIWVKFEIHQCTGACCDIDNILMA